MAVRNILPTAACPPDNVSMMAILTGSASAVPVATHPTPASASAAQNVLIAPSLFDRSTTLCTHIAREDSMQPCPPAPAVARARAASCSAGWGIVKEGNREQAGAGCPTPACSHRMGYAVTP